MPPAKLTPVLPYAMLYFYPVLDESGASEKNLYHFRVDVPARVLWPVIHRMRNTLIRAAVAARPEPASLRGDGVSVVRRGKRSGVNTAQEHGQYTCKLIDVSLAQCVACVRFTSGLLSCVTQVRHDRVLGTCPREPP